MFDLSSIIHLALRVMFYSGSLYCRLNAGNAKGKTVGFLHKNYLVHGAYPLMHFHAHFQDITITFRLVYRSWCHHK